MNIYTVTITGLDGPDPKFDAAGSALLFGVTVEQIKAVAPGPIPADYWARKDHNAELLLVPR